MTTKTKTVQPDAPADEAPGTSDLRELLKLAAASGELKTLIAEAEAANAERELTPPERLIAELRDHKLNPGLLADVLETLLAGKEG